MFVLRKVFFGKPLSKLSRVCFPLEKLVNGKLFPVKENFGLIFKKVFLFYFRRKTLCRNCEKFRNIILFVDNVKFDPQTFLLLYILFKSFFFNYFP